LFSIAKPTKRLYRILIKSQANKMDASRNSKSIRAFKISLGLA